MGRRWGQSVAGWLVGLPLTSGPVALFLALDYGPRFASRAAIGSLAGTAAQAGFCLVYARVARIGGWPIALAAATIAYVLGAVAFESAAPPLTLLLAIVPGALAAALWFVPPSDLRIARETALSRWDLPARMAVAAGLVFGLSRAAPLTGPGLAGFLATYPVFATVLTVFAQRSDGEPAAQLVLRGLLIGLFGFTAFFAVLAFALEPIGIAGAFAGAVLAAGVVQSGSLWLMRRGDLHRAAPG